MATVVTNIIIILSVFVCTNAFAVSAIEPVTRTDISPSTADNTFQTVDVSGLVPVGTEGICFEVRNTTTTERTWGIRHGDSTDSIIAKQEDKSHQWGCIGINSSRELDIAISNVAIVIQIVGYVPAGAGEFLVNEVDHSTETGSQWIDVDISGDFSGGTCAVAFFHFDAGTADATMCTRPNGRTVACTGNSNDNDNISGMMGLDANEIFEQFIGVTTTELYVHGCLYAGSGVHVVLSEDQIDFQTNTLGSYQATTITDAQADNATGIFFTTQENGEAEHAIRKNGSSFDPFGGQADVADVRYGWVECDTSQIIEQRIENTARDLFVWGWTFEIVSGNPGTGSINGVEIQGDVLILGKN